MLYQTIYKGIMLFDIYETKFISRREYISFRKKPLFLQLEPEITVFDDYMDVHGKINVNEQKAIKVLYNNKVTHVLLADIKRIS